MGVRALACVLLLLLFPGLGGAQQAQPTRPTRPTIDKIDPPNWFADLPGSASAPLLLIHGTGLHGAEFTVSSPGTQVIKIDRTLTSPNGHWALVWIDLLGIHPGTVQLTATSSGGATPFSYRIEAKRLETEVASGFSPADVMYNMMPDRFADGDRGNDEPPQSPGSYDRSNPHAYHGGDLRGILDHLDYLQQLGATALWLTPVVANDPHSKDYHGYGATDMYAVDAHLGTVATYRQLGDELHRRHMKLIFDDVPNHLGPKHPWVEDPPLPDWFHGTKAHHTESSADFETITDPHAAPLASRDVLDGWFVNILPDLNQEEPAVAQYLLQNMIWWIEEGGVDALRIDTFPYSQRAFWQGYLGTLKAIYPHLTAVGEVSGEDPTINAFFAGGRTLLGYDTHLDTPFDYPMWHTVRDVLLKGESVTRIEDTLRQDWLYPHPELLVTIVGNHDVWRFLSEPHATPALLRLNNGLVLTMRGLPQLYAGDEVNMLGAFDPDNRRDFPGGFPGDPHNTFTAAGRTPEQSLTHDFIATLATLRGHTPALQTGKMQTIDVDEDQLAFVRMGGSGASACPGGTDAGSVLVLMNRSPKPILYNVPVAQTALEGCRTLRPLFGDTDGKGTHEVSGQSINLNMPGLGFALYAVR